MALIADPLSYEDAVGFPATLSSNARRSHEMTDGLAWA